MAREATEGTEAAPAAPEVTGTRPLGVRQADGNDPNATRDPDPEPAPRAATAPADPPSAPAAPAATDPPADPPERTAGAPVAGESQILQQLHEAQRALIAMVERGGAAAAEASDPDSAIQTAIEAAEGRLASRLDQVEANIQRISRPSAPSEATANGCPAEVTEALVNVLMTAGQDGGNVVEATAAYTERLREANLLAGDNTGGGYLLPAPMRGALVELMQEESPMLPLVDQVTLVEGYNYERPRQTAKVTASRRGQVQKLKTTSLNFGKEFISATELTALVKVGNMLVDSRSRDWDGFLRREFAMQFARQMGYEVINGNGQQEFEGVMTASGIKEYTTIASNKMSADDIKSLADELLASYAMSATWAFGRKALTQVRTLKDSDGRFYWQPSLSMGSPNLIDGRPYVRSDAFGDPATDNAIVGALCDWRRMYTVTMRPEIRYLVDPFNSKNDGLVEFSARLYSGGGVVDPFAGVRIKAKA